MLERAQQLGLNVVGVHFHVGSNTTVAVAHADGIRKARQAFDIAEQIGYKEFNILDIGGGFPGEQRLNSLFEKMAIDIKRQLSESFPSTDTRFENLRIIAECGRFFSASVVTLVTRVIGKHEDLGKQKRGQQLYLNDGLYQSMLKRGVITVYADAMS